jgi:hypothetical protein
MIINKPQKREAQMQQRQAIMALAIFVANAVTLVPTFAQKQDASSVPQSDTTVMSSIPTGLPTSP